MGDFATIGSQTYANAVTLAGVAGARTLASTAGGKIWFKNTVDAAAAGVQGLTVNTSGTTEFDAAVGGGKALASLTTDNEGQAGELTELNMTAAAGKGGVNAGTVTINDAVIFNVDASALNSASVKSSGGSSQSQTYAAAATLSRDTVLADTGNKDIVFSSTVDGARSLIVTTGGAAKLGGVVGGVAKLGAVTLAANDVEINALTTDNGQVTLKADNVTISGSVNSGTATTLIDPQTSSRSIDLGTKSSGSLSLNATEIKSITAGVLRFGNNSDYSGNIAITQPISLGDLTADLRTLSLKTTSGSVSETGAGMVTVAKLSLDASKVSLELNCNNINTLAANWTTELAFKEQDTSVIFADVINKLDGVSYPVTLTGAMTASFFYACGSIATTTLPQQLAGITYLDIPVPRLSLTELELGANIDTGKAQEQYGPSSIVTYYLQVPFPKKRFSLNRLKLEEQSKWIGGQLAVSGSTAGPQTPR
jgi:hypothetical protein